MLLPEKMELELKQDSMENVLLLAMSTLPRNIKENMYYYKAGNENWNFSGKSQLAADTKAILSMIEKENCSISRIVILATKETLTINEIVGVSAVDYYIDEIKSYASLTTSDKDEHLLNRKEIDDECFKIISLDEKDAFPQAVDAIKGSDNKQINLYIDVQGGLRSAATQINAIVELLSTQNVDIIGRFANDFNPGEAGPYLIHSVDDEYNTYNLVTAMEMFRLYGRGDGLQTYFKNASYKDKFAQNLSNAIKKAAKAIQLCDVDGFDKAVDQIKKLDEGIDINTVSPELRIIYQDIKDDYAPIINAKYRYIEQIRWCLKKNFVQQAMTILESKMPEEYVQNGVKYFSKVSEKQTTIQKLAQIYNHKYVNNQGKSTKDAYKMKNVNHYYINYYEKDKQDTHDPLTSTELLQEYYGVPGDSYKNEVENNLKEYRNIKGIRNQTNHAQSDIDNDGFFKHMKALRSNDRTFNNHMQEVNVISKINNYLEEWEQLANQVPTEVVADVADVR